MTQDNGQQTATSETSGVENHLARHGKVSYLEIPALDTAKSAAFYEKVFGWNLRGGSPDHRSFADAAGDMIGAWVTGRPIAREPGVLPYIYVDQIDAVVAQITANRGQIVKPIYPEGDLWVATFRDPAGNVIGVWQGGPR